MVKISEFFTDAETVITSHRTIPNSYAGNPEVCNAVIGTAYFMDMVRKFLNAPVIVSSWYRCPF